MPSPSQSPLDGPVVSGRFDLSVVQLSAEGPDLPAECELARNDELQNIEGRLVGLLSYPGRGDAQLPDVSDSRFAEFAPSLVVPSIFRSNDPAVTSDSVVYIKRNPVSGASGSPVFFPNGHVVGLFAGTFTNRYEKVGGGPKINILRELVAYHKLQALLPAFEVRAARQSNGGPDLCLEDLGTAVRFGARCRPLAKGGSLSCGSEKVQ